MALDKLVDSAQLDNGLLSIAAAIRDKGGTNETLTFPLGFVRAIQNMTVDTSNARCFLVTIDANIVSQAYYQINPNGDAEIGSHRQDTSFVAGMIALFTASSASTRAILQTNNQMHTDSSQNRYGVYMSSGAGGTSAGYVQQPIGGSAVNAKFTMNVTSNGVIQIFNSSAYPLLPGNYLVLCGWDGGETNA